MKAHYAQLLVHLDACPRAEARLTWARALAQQQGAAVDALYGVLAAQDTTAYSPEAGVALAAPTRDENKLERAQAMYQRVMANPGPQVRLEEMSAGLSVAAFVQRALYADLLVLGQHDASSPQAGDVPPDFADRVMATSGKPALVLPYAGTPATHFNTVAIAWAPTREAARAVDAAMPLLQNARQVHIINWSEGPEPTAHERQDLVRYLLLRGVASTYHPQGQVNKDIGDLLLSYACDLGADLLVMGCYGHSRTREWLLGGTTRTILQTMTLPVLMAH